MEKMTEANVVPLISTRVTNAEEALLNLRAENDVVILDQYIAQYDMLRNLVQIPIRGSRSGLVAIYRAADKMQPAIQELIGNIKILLA